MAKEIARKLTIALVAGKASKWFKQVMEANGEKVKLCSIYGAATGYQVGATEYGEFLRFRGQFRGVNVVTGETMDAPICILPNHVAESLRSVLEAGNVSASFALDIYAVFDAELAVKYKYVVESALPPSENDPLAAIEQAMRQAALPAPAASVAAPATAPAAAPAAAGKGKGR